VLKEKDLNLESIFLTHHHGDHIGGVSLLREVFRDVKIYASRYDVERNRVPKGALPLDEGDRVCFAGVEGRILFLPGHTLGHIAYLFEEPLESEEPKEPQIQVPQQPLRQPVLFIGDTLFGGGSGGIFEGTTAQMLASLKQVRELPDSTLVFCAHEYTEKNLWVALQLKEDNPDQKALFEQVVEARLAGKFTVPLNLGVEKKTNPFLRWDVSTLQVALGTSTELETFSKVRSFRNKF
jgi:hydroxyacylglutathione hydrolase